MRFTMHFDYWGARQEVTWEDGVLAGPNEPLLERIRIEAEALEGSPVGLPPTDPFTMTNHLSSGMSTCWLVRRMIAPADLLDVAGDVPEPPELTDGATP